MNSISNTTNVTAGTVGSADLVLWAIQCLSQHHLVAPDQTTALVLAGAMVPLFHWVGRVICNYVKCEEEPPKAEVKP